MNYGIYFDESNKLDQPNGSYSYYGALGATLSQKNKLIASIQQLNEKLKSKSEMHFVDYTSDTYFEKYFKALNHVLEQDISINLMIVNKEDAKNDSEENGCHFGRIKRAVLCENSRAGNGTRQLRTIQGYLSELNGEGRNGYYFK